MIQLLFHSKKRINSIAKLNSTSMWNLTLQIHHVVTMEFIYSEISYMIVCTNMVVPSRQQGDHYEQTKTFEP